MSRGIPKTPAIQQKSTDVHVTPVNPYDTPTQPIASDTVSKNTTPAKPIPAAPANPHAANTSTHRNVIVQRPHDVADDYFFIGHNAFVGQFKYDVPVSLPIEVIEHMRTIMRVTHRPGPDGQIQTHTSNAFAVMDA